jgi:signal transduction histidine kinase
MSDTVLYVDDDTTNLRVFEATLRKRFRVLCAESGAEALEALRREEVAVLVTDQRMPRMSGVELLEVTARDYPDTVRILVTAYSDLDAAVGAINRGKVSRYIRKPWTPEELRAVIGEGLDHYRMKGRLRALERQLRETERVYALGVVAASIAHDLRNPITVAVAAMDLLRRALESEPGAAASGAVAKLDNARRAVERIAEIVAGVDASQRRTRATTTADLAEVIRLTISCLQGAARRKGELRVELQPVPRVQGSPTALGQVIMNLLVNALEALPEDGGPDGSVTIRLRREDLVAVVEVEDTGPGIAPEALPRIFDPFFTTKSEGGTGLGLAISKRIVDEVKGSIEGTSEPGAGTRFVVRLPLAPEVPAGPALSP